MQHTLIPIMMARPYGATEEQVKVYQRWNTQIFFSCMYKAFKKLASAYWLYDVFNMEGQIYKLSPMVAALNNSKDFFTDFTKLQDYLQGRNKLCIVLEEILWIAEDRYCRFGFHVDLIIQSVCECQLLECSVHPREEDLGVPSLVNLKLAPRLHQYQWVWNANSSGRQRRR